jgi:hypothetical protein
MACSKHASASACCRAAASAIPFRIHSSAFIAQNHRPPAHPAQYVARRELRFGCFTFLGFNVAPGFSPASFLLNVVIPLALTKEGSGVPRAFAFPLFFRDAEHRGAAQIDG